MLASEPVVEAPFGEIARDRGPTGDELDHGDRVGVGPARRRHEVDLVQRADGVHGVLHDRVRGDVEDLGQDGGVQVEREAFLDPAPPPDTQGRTPAGGEVRSDAAGGQIGEVLAGSGPDVRLDPSPRVLNVRGEPLEQLGPVEFVVLLHERGIGLERGGVLGETGGFDERRDEGVALGEQSLAHRADRFGWRRAGWRPELVHSVSLPRGGALD